jgi:hypothetical protein
LARNEKSGHPREVHRADTGPHERAADEAAL